MSKVVSPITAKIEVIGKLRDGTYGEYHPVLFLDQAQPEGSEAAKIWKNFTPEEVSSFKKGQVVQLVPTGKTQAGKDKFTIVRQDLQTTPSVPVSSSPPLIPQRPEEIPPTWDADQKQQMAATICDNADLFLFCYQTVAGKFAGLADPRDFRAIATTLFLHSLNTTP